MKYILVVLLLIGISAYATYYLFAESGVDEIVSHTPLSQMVETLSSTEPTVTLPSPPPTKVLPSGTQVFQTFNNCGPASLSMALSHYDIHVSQQTLGQALRPHQHPEGDNDDKSVTLSELAQKAEEYGFIAYYRPAGDMEMIQQFIAHEMPVITRTWLRPNEDIGHYRVVKGYDRTTAELIQDDSLQGKDLRYSEDDFNEIWEAFNYEFLVLVPVEKQAIAEAILGDRLDEESAWNRALAIADQQLATNPNNHYAHFNRSVALYHLGQYQDSIEAYEQAAPSLPGRMMWYQVEPLLAYYQVGEYDQVLSMSQEILTNENRAYSELYYLRGLVFQYQGNNELATEAFANAQKYNTATYWKNNVRL
ncbi:MAG TPA: C39 family peptidase [Patescibacteria group bacterium]